jgi:hypothetical protein
MACASLEPVS